MMWQVRPDPAEGQGDEGRSAGMSKGVTVTVKTNELWPIYLYEAHHFISMASTVKETVMPVHEETEEGIKALLEGTDAAWAQYKQGQGTRVAGTKELDAFLDSL